MFAIFKKELRSYFINAIGYVYVGVFLTAAAILCCYTTLGSQSYDTDSYFTFLIFSFIILIPLLTMKLFSEEKKLRTEQLLMTATSVGSEASTRMYPPRSNSRAMVDVSEKFSLQPKV